MTIALHIMTAGAKPEQKSKKNNDDKFDLAHFNPKELDVLDKVQGGRRYMKAGNKDSDVPLYDVLEDMIKTPEVQKMIKGQYEKHARGGRIGDMLRDADKMRTKGRNGDNQIACVGPETRKTLNRYLHGGSINPGTGKFEYFGLSHLVHGIGNTISSGVKSIGNTAGKALGTVGNMATQALPGAIMGGMEGGPEGALMGGAMSMMGGGQPQSNVMQAPSNYQLPQNLSGLGQQFMNSSYGQNLQNQAQGYMNNMNKQMGGIPGAAYNAYNAMPPQARQQVNQGAMNMANRYAPQSMARMREESGQMRDNYGRANRAYQGAAQHPYAQNAVRGYNNYMNARNPNVNG